MSGNSTIGAIVTGGEDTIPKRIAALETRVRELASVRSLNSSSIGSGGLTVNPGGTELELRVDENVDWYGENFTGAVLAFTTADGREGGMRLLDEGAGVPILEIRSAPSTDGHSSTVTLVEDGLTLAHQDASGLADANVQLGAGSVGISAGGTGANFYSGGLTMNVGFAAIQLQAALIRIDQLRWENSANTEWRATNGSGYVPVRASSFPTSSSRGAKQDIHDLPFDALEAVTAAPAQRWQYKPTESSDDRHHVSPMADELPPEIVAADGVDLSVDLRDLVGVLWAAVGQLSAQVADLKKASGSP